MPFTWLKLNLEEFEGLGWDPEHFVDSSIHQLDLNPTGNPELLLEAVWDYLSSGSLRLEEPDRNGRDYIGCMLRAFAAERAAEGGLIEYGVALRHPSLTPEGEQWMRDYEAWFEKACTT